MEWTGFERIGGREIAPGLWRWVAFHPEWEADVGCAALASGDGLVLIDPLFPAGPDGEAALESLEILDDPPAIVLSVFYHERSSAAVSDRIPGTTLWVEQSGVANVESTVTNPFRAGDSLPGGMAAFATARPDEVVLWEPASRSLIAGDVLLGKGPRGIELCPDSWLPDGVGSSELSRSLLPLLDLPVARILVGHGEPLLRGAHSGLKNLLDQVG